jgi:outer membrane immunogenic protein
MRAFLLAAVAAAAVAAPAFAQDAPAIDGPFTGPRVGAIVGYDRLQPGSTEDSDIRGDDQSADGLVYGGDIGYDFQRNNIVFGVEGEITGSTAKVNNNPVDPNSFGYGRVKAGRDLYLGARVGALLSPTTLLYAKGGYTNGRLDLTRNDTQITTDRHFNLDGYRVGAGIEQSMGGKAYVKAEYRYSNYGDARLEFPNGANTDNFSVDTDRHQVVVGAGIRF